MRTNASSPGRRLRGFLKPALALRMRRSGGSRDALDGSFMALVLSWVLSSASAAIMSLAPAAAAAAMALHLAYQFSVACAQNFLRLTVTRDTAVVGVLVWLQWALGSALLVWGFVDPGHHLLSMAAWQVVNVMGFTAVLLLLGQALLSGVEPPPWLTIGACLMGFGLGLSDMAAVDGPEISVSAMHNAFSVCLLVIWLLLTRRLDWLPTRKTRHEKSEHSVLGGEFADTDLDQGPLHDHSAFLDGSDGGARRRIAQELHDGVGSQLVNILASLDRSVPQQRSMADALEQCLLDVKILVDDIDSTQECVLDALARLRYRVQASLDRLGIHLHWDLTDDPKLQTVCDERGRQILRITQESLANVMRHSRARNVSVCCRYSPQAQALLLDITDDGVGFDSHDPGFQQGKGLQGMRRRAASVQADLLVRSLPRVGTSIRVVLPLREDGPFPPAQPVAQLASLL